MLGRSLRRSVGREGARREGRDVGERKRGVGGMEPSQSVAGCSVVLCCVMWCDVSLDERG